MDRAQYRKDKLAHCLRFLAVGDEKYALHAADWYEALEPWHLNGLGRAVRQEIEKQLLEKLDERNANRTDGNAQKAATSARVGGVAKPVLQLGVQPRVRDRRVGQAG